jgi:hypothetical protein
MTRADANRLLEQLMQYRQTGIFAHIGGTAVSGYSLSINQHGQPILRQQSRDLASLVEAGTQVIEQLTREN